MHVLETYEKIKDFLYKQSDTWIPAEKLEKQLKHPLIRNEIGGCYYAQTDKGMLQLDIREFDEVPHVSKVSLVKVDDELLSQSIEILKPFAAIFQKLTELQTHLEEHPNEEADPWDHKYLKNSEYLNGFDVDYFVNQARQMLGAKDSSEKLNVERVIQKTKEVLFAQDPYKNIQFKRRICYRKDEE